MTAQTLMWSAFGLLVTIMLVIDLGLNRRSHEISFREALTWSGVWIALAISIITSIVAVKKRRTLAL